MKYQCEEKAALQKCMYLC